MEKAECCICGKLVEGYLYNAQELSESWAAITSTIGYRCQNCGAVYCPDENKKHLKHSFWNGFKKSICPKCGQLFGPGFIFTSVPFSAQDKAEAPSLAAPTPLPPRQFKFTHLLDPLTNEQIVDELGVLILTDRRFIHIVNEQYARTGPMLLVHNQETFSGMARWSS